MVGDQRHHEDVARFVPQALRSNGFSLAWQELFEITLRNRHRVHASDCRLAGRSALTDANRFGNVHLLMGETFNLRCPFNIQVQWSAALLRTADGAEVFRTRTVLDRASGSGSTNDDDIAQLTLWEINLSRSFCHGFSGMPKLSIGQRELQSPGCLASTGDVDGSPLVDLSLGMWLALEHPRGKAAAQNGTLELGLLDPELGSQYFASLGVVGPAGASSNAEESYSLLRRHFNAYMDVIRASAHRPHLHLSTWYDLRRKPCVESSRLGYPSCSAAQTLNEQKTMERLLQVHRELNSRGVPLDGLLLDDGWDDAKSPWHVEPNNFPVGLQGLESAAAARGAGLGVWMSPWGGFGEGGKRRVALGPSQGFEVYEEGPRTLRFAGPRYYRRFSNVSRDLALRSGVSFFKFDGIGSGLEAVGADRFTTDVERLIQLIATLREDAGAHGIGRKKSMWVTVSTGSWPSPFWLMSADAIWRGGPDLGRLGVGSLRQQWITFRDFMVYKWVAQRAPLFPLASVALGGIVWSRAEEPGAYLASFDIEDFACDVWSFFLSGAAYQELLIQPELLTPTHWDILSKAANVSRHHAHTLQDAHWAGGNPAAGEVYGYASYACSPCLGLLSWRNPLLRPQNVTFTLRRSLSVPRSWPGGATGGHWQVRSLWPEAGPPGAPPIWGRVALDQPLKLELQGLELRVLQVSPLLP